MAHGSSFHPDYKSAVIAGVIGGILFMLFEMMMMPLYADTSGWVPMRMKAAMVLGTSVLPPPTTFETGIFIVATIIHFALSIGFAVLFALLCYRLNTALAVIAGGLFGLLLYVVNYHGIALLFTWFAEARTWIAMFSHLVYGFAIAFAYKEMEHRVWHASGVWQLGRG